MTSADLPIERPKVLVIAYHYPPVGGVGVRRTLAFVRNLLSLGWDVGVVTPQNPVVGALIDSGEPQPLADDRVLRTPGVEPRSYKVRNYLLVPDEWAGWIRLALSASMHWSFAREADVVYSSAPPYSSLVIAAKLAREFDKPWVADFRDPWTFNQTYSHHGLRAAWDRRLERRVFREASAIVVVTPEMASEYAQMYPESADKVLVVPNGFEARTAHPPKAPSTGPLTIVHAGTIGGSRVDVARSFLDAMGSLAGSFGKNDIRVRFLGLLSNEAHQLVSSHPWGGLVEMPGLVPHDALAGEYAAADVLLLLGNTEPLTVHVATGKIYEYLVAERPVLAIVPSPGAASRIITETGVGLSVDPSDVQGIADAVAKLVHSKRRGDLTWSGDPAKVALYDRSLQAAKLETVLREVIQRHRGDR